MSFKIPSVEEMEKLRATTDAEVPPLFRSSRKSGIELRSGGSSGVSGGAVSKPASSRDSRASDENLQPDAEEEDDSDVNQKSSDPGPPSCSSSSSSTASSLQQSKAIISSSGATASGSGVVVVPVVSTSEASAPAAPTRPPMPNSIIVSPRQRGNPILKFVRNVPWEYGDIVPDYQLSATSCALYLSLRYHNLKPNYVHERLRQLANSYILRVLLVQVDVKDCNHALKELAKICILADCTMVLAFTLEEAGRYLETYKSFESKPPDMIMEKTDSNYLAKLTDTLTSAKKVNKTDAITLLTAFGSFEKIVQAEEQDLALCPGLGPQKASRIHNVFHQPFLKETKKPHPSAASQGLQPKT